MTSDWTIWTTLETASHILLWIAVLFVGFLLLGALRTLQLLRWRQEQLEATMPSRLGRSGLKPGKKAPDFLLPSVAGPEIALHEFAGRKVFLVFTQSGCGPCEQILPELNRLERRDVQVLVVNKGGLEATRQWVAQSRLHFPVLVQNGLDISRKYEAFATPFAFLIDEKGTIFSRGVISSRQHISYLLSGVRDNSKNENGEHESDGKEPNNAVTIEPRSIRSKEITHA
jgi:methylamine dehydrogenase accessory protein MauD